MPNRRNIRQISLPLIAALGTMFLLTGSAAAQVVLLQPAPCVEVERMKQSLGDVFFGARHFDLKGSEAVNYIAAFNDKGRVPGRDLQARPVDADRVLIAVTAPQVRVLFSLNRKVCADRFELGLRGHHYLMLRSRGWPT